MEAAALLAAAQRHFADPGPPHSAAGLTILPRHGQPIGLAVLAAQTDGMAYLRAFEDGMQALLAARQQQPGLELALVLDMQPALEQTASYRAALKKYSNSVVFEDVVIGLLLLSSRPPLWLPPAEVNPFLRQLDRWLLA